MSGTLLTTLEVAERLGLSSAAVTQAVRSGALEPTARTNEDFLFTERAVTAFAERRAEAAAAPLEPPPAVSRVEWSGDVDRLNSWLKDLSESAPAAAQPAPPAAQAGPPAGQAAPLAAPVPAAPVPAPPPALAPIATPEEARPAIDFRPPPHPVAELPAAAPPLPRPETIAEPEPAPAREPLPQAAAQPPPAPVLEPAPHAVAETPAKTDPLLDAAVGGPARPAVEAPAEPEPAPVAAAEPPAVEQPHLPTAAEATAPLPEAVAALKSGLSRQAVLVVEPIERFRILRDIADRLAAIPGVDDARLERLEGGLASYRLSFGINRPTGEAIAGALAPLGLQVMLVDTQ
jgi:hypothetical protein